MDSNTSRAKRQRTSPTPATTVNHLSADLWCDIAEFLPKTSRALLAVALTAPPASFRESGWKGQPNAVSRAIIASAKDSALSDAFLEKLGDSERFEDLMKGEQHDSKNYGDFNFRDGLAEQIKHYYNSQWEMMDFVDLPKSLALRLTDDDVGAVLVCIDAANNLKRLKLTNCFNVVGTCLEPLRRSTVLEYVDLELVREFDKPWFEIENEGRVEAGLDLRRAAIEREFDEIKLCEGPVFDVLGDILREDGNSLKRLQYPFRWYCDPPTDAVVFGNYEWAHQTMSGRFNQFVNDHNAVVNKFACCLYFNTNAQSVCTRLEENSPSDYANICITCSDTSYSFCTHCNEILCTGCSATDECSVCDVRYCLSCCTKRAIAEKEATVCGYGDCQSFCPSCRLDACKNQFLFCIKCRDLSFDGLLEECNAKQAQIDALRLEIETLTLHRSSDR